MSNLTTVVKCGKEKLLEILLDPIKYNLTEYDKMEKITETSFIQYFGKNNELKMTYDIVYDMKNNTVRIVIVNENSNVEIILFKILQFGSLEVKVEVLDEIYVKGFMQQTQIKFLKLIGANDESLNSLVNHLNELVK
ncbi:MAG: hypothetical protein RR646_04480 [Erysipelotrichaceae bacterium]